MPMKFNVTKQWCQKSADLEGDSEVGAGPVRSEDIRARDAEIERLKTLLTRAADALGDYHGLYQEELIAELRKAAE
jgi:hypothetical protein